MTDPGNARTAELADPSEPPGPWPSDYMQEYRDIWREIVEYPDGTVNTDQVARELADYSALMTRVTEVYMHITGGRVSKPETSAAAVIGLYDEHVMEIEQAAVTDAVKALAERIEDPELLLFIREVILARVTAHGLLAIEPSVGVE